MTDIDNLNAKILHELTGDGRISNIDLANKVGLSPSACLRRVQELERKGIISGYRAVLNPQALGIRFIAYGRPTRFSGSDGGGVRGPRVP
jgi:Lrp/AsnC family transcriptional regulator, leucine-responsive regulatory protein